MGNVHLNLPVHSCWQAISLQLRNDLGGFENHDKPSTSAAAATVAAAPAAAATATAREGCHDLLGPSMHHWRNGTSSDRSNQTIVLVSGRDPGSRRCRRNTAVWKARRSASSSRSKSALALNGATKRVGPCGSGSGA